MNARRLFPFLLSLAVGATGCASAPPLLQAHERLIANSATTAPSPPAAAARRPAPALGRWRSAPPRRPSATLVVHGPRTRRLVALTFDADMTPGMLAALRSGRQRTWLDDALFRELDRTHTPATIFLTGLWTETYPSFVRKLARNRLYELENHSYDHAAWTGGCYGLRTVATPDAQAREVSLAQQIIRRVTGRAPLFFRFPGGCQTAADRRLVARLGLRPVGWDVVSGDAFNPSPDAIVRSVLGGVLPGSIVVAHCIGAPNAPATAAAVARIIPALRARGYRFVTLARLIGVRSTRAAARTAGSVPGRTRRMR